MVVFVRGFHIGNQILFSDIVLGINSVTGMSPVINAWEISHLSMTFILTLYLQNLTSCSVNELRKFAPNDLVEPNIIRESIIE